MKVKELKELLDKFDPELTVLSSDHDNWCYDMWDAEVDFVVDGRRVEDPGDGSIEKCLILIAG